MKKSFKLFIILILLIVLSYIVIRNTSKVSTPTSKVNNIPNTEEIINYLCSETINDRAIGTEGNKLVTTYIENLFKALELNPVFSDSFLNNFYYESENLNLSNVVGKLNGTNNNKAIIITSHFDAWCNGALDNASGVATTFRIINKLKRILILFH